MQDAFADCLIGACDGGGYRLLLRTLARLAEIDYDNGRWSESHAEASVALRLAEEAGEDDEWASLLLLARLEAAQGRERECRAHVARMLAVGAALAMAPATEHSILGFLELGLNRTGKAIAHLEEAARRRGAREHCSFPLRGEADLVEAYVRARREPEARDLLSRLEAEARTSGSIPAIAAAARCRGLVAGKERLEEAFEQALAWQEQAPSPFERARTELCYGERLRRSRRRVDARAPLASALDTFERLGAAPWAERARREHEATSEHARRRVPATADLLTPHELRVAQLVARGATNREAAGALFASPKTIEAQLGRIYRKLDIRSRTELAGLLARSSWAGAV